MATLAAPRARQFHDALYAYATPFNPGAYPFSRAPSELAIGGPASVHRPVLAVGGPASALSAVGGPASVDRPSLSTRTRAALRHNPLGHQVPFDPRLPLQRINPPASAPRQRPRIHRAGFDFELEPYISPYAPTPPPLYQSEPSPPPYRPVTPRPSPALLESVSTASTPTQPPVPAPTPASVVSRDDALAAAMRPSRKRVNARDEAAAFRELDGWLGQIEATAPGGASGSGSSPIQTEASIATPHGHQHKRAKPSLQNFVTTPFLLSAVVPIGDRICNNPALRSAESALKRIRYIANDRYRILDRLRSRSFAALDRNQQLDLGEEFHLRLKEAPPIPLEASVHHPSGGIDWALRPWSLDMCLDFVHVICTAHRAMRQWCARSDLLSDEAIDAGRELHLAVAFLGLGHGGKWTEAEALDALKLCVRGGRISLEAAAGLLSDNREGLGAWRETLGETPIAPFFDWDTDFDAWR